MKSVQINEFGEPDVLTVVEATRPEIREDDEILVHVRASGVNFFEVLMRRDQYAVTPSLPATFGVEIAGTVEAAGRNTGVTVGSRVAVPLFAIGRDGGYAEYVVVKGAAAVPIPEAVSFEAAVALQVQGLTALHAVRQTSPNGKSVLITAAGGGVGTLLIQLAKQAGAKRIVALAGSDEKLRTAVSLGADLAFNYRSDGWSARCRAAAGDAGFDIVYDFVGGSQTSSFVEMLTQTGVLLFGALGRFALDIPSMNKLLADGQTVKGFALLPLLQAGAVRHDLTELFQLTAAGRLTPVIGGRFPLQNAADAHRHVETRQSTGKIMLVP